MRHLPIVVVLIVGAVMSLLGYLGIVTFGHSKSVAEFDAKAAERISAVERRLASELAIVDTLVAYLSVDDQ